MLWWQFIWFSKQQTLVHTCINTHKKICSSSWTKSRQSTSWKEYKIIPHVFDQTIAHGNGMTIKLLPVATGQVTVPNVANFHEFTFS